MRFHIRFRARKIGALGITYRHDQYVEASDYEAARLKLYDEFEHITIFSGCDSPDSQPQAPRG